MGWIIHSLQLFRDVEALVEQCAIIVGGYHDPSLVREHGRGRMPPSDVEQIQPCLPDASELHQDEMVSGCPQVADPSPQKSDSHVAFQIRLNILSK